jgi:ubiquinone biosynthesis protein Coq4
MITGTLQLTGNKFKYSCRQDKAVATKDDYIEELEMRWEETADIWHLTNDLIYGGKGYIVQITSLKNQLREAKLEIKIMKKHIDKYAVNKQKELDNAK